MINLQSPIAMLRTGCVAGYKLETNLSVFTQIFTNGTDISTGGAQAGWAFGDAVNKTLNAGIYANLNNTQSGRLELNAATLPNFSPTTTYSGMEVLLGRVAGPETRIRTKELFLINTTISQTSQDKADTSVDWFNGAEGVEIITYGSPTNMWGLTGSESLFENGGLKLRLNVESIDDNELTLAYIDYAILKIYYT